MFVSSCLMLFVGHCYSVVVVGWSLRVDIRLSLVACWLFVFVFFLELFLVLIGCCLHCVLRRFVFVVLYLLRAMLIVFLLSIIVCRPLLLFVICVC